MKIKGLQKLTLLVFPPKLRVLCFSGAVISGVRFAITHLLFWTDEGARIFPRRSFFPS